MRQRLGRIRGYKDLAHQVTTPGNSKPSSYHLSCSSALEGVAALKFQSFPKLQNRIGKHAVLVGISENRIPSSDYEIPPLSMQSTLLYHQEICSNKTGIGTANFEDSVVSSSWYTPRHSVSHLSSSSRIQKMVLDLPVLMPWDFSSICHLQVALKL